MPLMQPATFEEHLAYITGVALGDGNLSNPNGRAIRLRITCDTRYPKLIDRFTYSIRTLLPNNQVSLINTAPTHANISCYSNKWEGWLGWNASGGTKCWHFSMDPFQSDIPVFLFAWINRDRRFNLPRPRLPDGKLCQRHTPSCHRGLFNN